MKSTGIVRKVDELGRIVLPIELRRTLEILERDPMEIYVEGNTIILKKYEPVLKEDRDKKYICAICRREFDIVE
jgi:AbrB family looped-hinge helix DNA binding protein